MFFQYSGCNPQQQDPEIEEQDTEEMYVSEGKVCFIIYFSFSEEEEINLSHNFVILVTSKKEHI